MPSVSRQVLDHLYAGERGQAEAVAAGAELDLCASAALADLDRVRTILEQSAADVNALTGDGFTALHLAAFFGSAEVVEALLGAGAAPDVVAGNPSRVTPLHSAIAHQSVASASMLLEAGSPVDAHQAGGFTALHAAARHGHAELVRVLLDHGAEITLTDEAGMTAADHARAGGYEELAAELA